MMEFVPYEADVNRKQNILTSFNSYMVANTNVKVPMKYYFNFKRPATLRRHGFCIDAGKNISGLNIPFVVCNHF